MKKWIISHLLLAPVESQVMTEGYCDYTKCSRHLRDHGSCKQLFHYDECMEKFDRVCRGDMLYHSNIKGVKLKLDKMKCAERRARKLSRLKSRPDKPKRRNQQKSTEDTSSSFDASNSAGFQADQAPQCRWESSRTRPLCAILGADEMFRVKGFDGIPRTNCPLEDGAIPIIELPYLVVMGSITDQKLTKVTSIVRDSGACAEFKSWHGEVDELTPYFSDGTTHTGYNQTVFLKEIGPNAIQLTLQHINTKITIRQVIGGNWLQFSAVVPEELLPEGDGSLCSSACPLQTPSNRNRPRGKAVSDSRCDSFWCRELRSTWGELAAVDARQLNPVNWDVFNEHQEEPLIQSNGLYPSLLNYCILLLIYLIVL